MSNSTSNRVLILVRDHDSLVRVKESIVHGQDIYQDSRYRWFISSECAKIRSVQRTSAQAMAAKKQARTRKAGEAFNEEGQFGGGAIDRSAEEESGQEPRFSGARLDGARRLRTLRRDSEALQKGEECVG